MVLPDDPQHYINPDPGYAENFLFADVKPGDYEVYTQVQGVEYRAAVTVTAGDVSMVTLITEAYKTPTPTPIQSPTESPTPSATVTPEATAADG